MRINKKLIPKKLTRHGNGWGEPREYVYINGDVVGGVIFAVAVASLLGLFVYFVNHIGARDETKFNYQCKLIANGKPHFVTNSPNPNVMKQCKIGPDWKGVDL